MSWLTQRPLEQVIRAVQGKRQLEITKLLGESSTAVLDFRTTILNPSRRLSLMVEIFYGAVRLTGAVAAAQLAELQASGMDSFLEGDGSNTFTMRAQADGVDFATAYPTAVNVGSGNLHILVEGAQLPYAYEIDSAIRRLEVTGNVVGPLSVAANPVFLTWFLRARWEPNTPMDDKELVDLFGNCHLV